MKRFAISFAQNGMLATIQEEVEIREFWVSFGRPGDRREYIVHPRAKLQAWPGSFELQCRHTVHPAVSVRGTRFRRIDRRTIDVFSGLGDYRLFFDDVYDMVDFWYSIRPQ